KGAARVGVGAAGRLLNRAHRVTAVAHLPFAQRLEAKMMGLPAGVRTRLLRDHTVVTPVQDIIEQAVDPVRDRDDMTKLNYFLLKVELPDQMLTKVDRMTMAHGLEARLPFLDHRIVEFLAGVSMGVKLKGMERKHVLRRAVGDLLPPEILRKGKRGFGMPFQYGVGEKWKALELVERFDNQWGAIVDRGILESLLKSADGRWGESRDGAWALGMLVHAVTQLPGEGFSSSGNGPRFGHA
ncbi:MAG: asparagine synthase-related protein, partial [bacterium]